MQKIFLWYFWITICGFPTQIIGKTQGLKHYRRISEWGGRKDEEIKKPPAGIPARGST
jgi:hypothetical protein